MSIANALTGTPLWKRGAGGIFPTLDGLMRVEIPSGTSLKRGFPLYQRGSEVPKGISRDLAAALWWLSPSLRGFIRDFSKGGTCASVRKSPLAPLWKRGGLGSPQPKVFQQLSPPVPLKKREASRLLHPGGRSA